MAYLIAQGLFAAVFYPLFLILLSVVATFLTVTTCRWKKIFALVIFAFSAVATFLSLNYFVDPAVEVSIYLIASTVFMVFLGHYFSILVMPNAPQRGNLVYCLMLIFLPVLDFIFAMSGSFTSANPLAEQTMEMAFFIDILRWPLNLILAVWTSIHYKIYRRFLFIGLGVIIYAAMLIQLAAIA